MGKDENLPQHPTYPPKLLFHDESGTRNMKKKIKKKNHNLKHNEKIHKKNKRKIEKRKWKIKIRKCKS